MTDDVQAYAGEVARRVHEILGDRLVGVWLVGSAALGDLEPASSDVDIQAVAGDRPQVRTTRRCVARVIAT